MLCRFWIGISDPSVASFSVTSWQRRHNLLKEQSCCSQSQPVMLEVVGARIIGGRIAKAAEIPVDIGWPPSLCVKRLIRLDAVTL